MIVIGLATYGYNIMRVLGNRLTMHSPSRGFSMELGASITVVLASQYGIPVSTTHTITGAIVGVGAAKRMSAVRWNVASSIVVAWVITLPRRRLRSLVRFSVPIRLRSSVLVDHGAVPSKK